MSKVLFKMSSPSFIVDDLSSKSENDGDTKDLKGFFHAVIPFMLSVVSLPVASVYFVCATLIYATVCRDRNESYFFSVVILWVFIVAVMLPS